MSRVSPAARGVCVGESDREREGALHRTAREFVLMPGIISGSTELLAHRALHLPLFKLSR